MKSKWSLHTGTADAHIWCCTDGADRKQTLRRMCVLLVAGRIALKFDMWFGAHKLCALHRSWMAYVFDTCGVHRTSPYLGNGWCTVLKFGVLLRVTSYGFLHATSGARLPVSSPFPRLGNCGTHRTEMWCAVIPINDAFYIGIWYRRSSVHTCRCTSFLASTRFRWFTVQKASYWFCCLPQKEEL